jgi:hypothetical protein
MGRAVLGLGQCGLEEPSTCPRGEAKDTPGLELHSSEEAADLNEQVQEEEV